MPRLDQLGLYVATDEAELEVKQNFGLMDAEWEIDDIIAMTIYHPGTPAETKIQTRSITKTTHDIGCELELLRFMEGPHWAALDNDSFALLRPFVSHAGVHLAAGEDFPPVVWPLVVESYTLQHSSAYLTTEGSPGFGRKYHYRVHRLNEFNYIKYTRRIDFMRAQPFVPPAPTLVSAVIA